MKKLRSWFGCNQSEAVLIVAALMVATTLTWFHFNQEKGSTYKGWAAEVGIEGADAELFRLYALAEVKLGNDAPSPVAWAKERCLQGHPVSARERSQVWDLQRHAWVGIPQGRQIGD